MDVIDIPKEFEFDEEEKTAVVVDEEEAPKGFDGADGKAEDC